GAGAALWLQADRQARQAQRTRAVNEALNQVTALREKAKAAADGPALLARAREQAQRALALVQAGPADEALQAQVRRVQGELEEEEKDRRLVARLEEVRLLQAELNVQAGRFATERALPEYRKVFAEHGLRAGGAGPAEAAAWV